jgi:hypothetical protein
MIRHPITKKLKHSHNQERSNMFNPNVSTDTKIAVLEERLTSYEVMMKKIDEAIQIMGKTSLSISKMLAVHEEKLEHTTKNDEVLISMINDMKEENKTDHKTVKDKVIELEKKVEEVTKFRWLIAGGIILATFIISQPHIMIDLLTPDPTPVRVEGTK